MKNTKFFTIFVIIITLLYLIYPNLTLAMDGEHVGSANKKPSSVKSKKQPDNSKKVVENLPADEKFKFSKTVNYEGKKSSSITITEEKTNSEYELMGNEIGKMIRDAGKKRKEKEEAAHSVSPLVPSKIVLFTSNVDGKRETAEHLVYEIKSKEDKRKLRNVIQKFFDECKKAREEETEKPSPLIIQRGSDAKNDMVIIRSGLDIAVAPLRRGKKEGDGYIATKPPAYGDGVDNSSKSFQKVLKLVEGVRSESASPLRHIAKKDEDFIGKAKGGAKKLRDYDEDKVTKKDEGKVLDLFADLFIEEAKTKKSLLKKDKILKKVKDALATETDYPSFYK